MVVAKTLTPEIMGGWSVEMLLICAINKGWKHFLKLLQCEPGLGCLSHAFPVNSKPVGRRHTCSLSQSVVSVCCIAVAGVSDFQQHQQHSTQWRQQGLLRKRGSARAPCTQADGGCSMMGGDGCLLKEGLGSKCPEPGPLCQAPLPPFVPSTSAFTPKKAARSRSSPLAPPRGRGVFCLHWGHGIHIWVK